MLQQIRHDFSCCLAERVRKHAGDADIGNGHTVLNAVLLRRFHADQFEAVSGKFPELAEIFGRDKGTSYKVKFVEVGNPFGILFIRFLAFDSFNIFGMCKADLYVLFEIIKNRNPILSCGFHTNVITIILDEPVVKPLNIRVDGWKRFLLVFGYSILVSGYDGCNDNIFVDIKSTADGVF